MSATENTKRSTRDLHLERKKMWDASMSNHARYLDPATGAFADKFVEARNCPACESNDARFMFEKSGGFYHACNRCSMVFLNPALKDNCLSEYYQMNHTVQGTIVAEDIAFYRGLYLQGLDRISSLLNNNGSILDVGCSTGIFLDIAKENGWQTHGLELNRQELEIARKKGHNVTEGMIGSAKLNEKFDAISLWDVFEHIKDGRQFLKDARPRLRDGGLVFVQSPSRDSLAARILQSACNMFDGLEHVNLYGRESLAIVAQSAGYEIASYETVISEIGVINNYLDYQDPYLGYSRDQDSVCGQITEPQILNSGIGYKFQASLRKVAN